MSWISRRAGRQAAVFIAVTLGVSFVFEGFVLTGHISFNRTAVFILMWIPAVASLLVRLVFRDGFGDGGWKPGRIGYLLWAYLAPAGCAALTYGLSLFAGVVVFAPRVGSESTSPLSTWGFESFSAITVGFAIGCLFALGEEIGWRGFLVKRLVDAKIPMPFVVSGIVWGLWHLPLVIWGGYAAGSFPWLSAALFLALAIVASIFFGWLRIASGSVWPAVIAHASHNAFYQRVFDHHFDGSLEPYFAGEAGVFSILAYGLLVFWLWRSGRNRSL
ncbi:lysostaphin resistance A-like protein [Myxococcota bacterium]